MKEKYLTFQASNSSGKVSAVFVRPNKARYLMVLGHGAGAGMHHTFMQELTDSLASQSVATLRYQFPYMEHGRKTPNPAPILMATVRSAISTAAELANGLPILAGGKSLGGRMTSSAAAKEPFEDVHGIAFFGFPLHAPGQPSNHRAEHLYNVSVPMLFLQGTRDQLSDLEYLRPVCKQIGRRATLHIVEGGDHSFKVPKSLNRTHNNVIEELARVTASWANKLR